MSSSEPDEFIELVFGIRNMPVDLEAEALESDGATCHACGATATVLVEDHREVGSAFYLCDEDFEFLSAGAREALAQRMATNYLEPHHECLRTADALISASGRAVHLPKA